MSRLLRFVLCWLLVSVSVRAVQPAPSVDLHRAEARAAVLFSPANLTTTDSALVGTCDRVTLFCQALSVLAIVAALLIQLRDERGQMEGVAATLVKVAFIALLPALRDMVIGAADVAASAIGYEPPTAGASSPTSDVWRLLEQWSPPGTPYLDALAAQDPENVPASGEEGRWTLDAWNWARGVGTASTSNFHALWQAESGSVRALLVFGCCGLMSCLLSLVLMLIYLGEVLRVVLFYGACSFLPVCIAGLALDALRGPSTKFILGTVAIAFWPLVWALGNVVTHGLVIGATAWMTEVTTSVLAKAGLPAAPLAVGAPYLGWGLLFVFVGLTIALCGWMVVTTLYAPVALTRAFSAGASWMAHRHDPPANRASTSIRSTSTATAITLRSGRGTLPPPTVVMARRLDPSRPAISAIPPSPIAPRFRRSVLTIPSARR
jgi:hypothetical protein